MATKQNTTKGNVNLDTSVILRPRITEKGARGSEAGVHVFDVTMRANKSSVARAVEKIYGVTVTRVNMTTVVSKKVGSRKGRPGKTATGKKAVVFLKKGDVITLS